MLPRSMVLVLPLSWIETAECGAACAPAGVFRNRTAGFEAAASSGTRHHGAPAARQADNLVERARFLEEVPGPFHDGDALLTGQLGGSGAVQRQHFGIQAADDQQG